MTQRQKKRAVQSKAKRPSAPGKTCSECDGCGISYVDKSKPIDHAYQIDHMNAHICTSCSGSGEAHGQ